MIEAVDWEAWIRKPGANPDVYKVSFETESAKEFEALADEYIALNGTKSPSNYKIYLEKNNPQLKTIFLNRIVARQMEANVTLDLIKRIDADYNCTWDINPEIGQRWFPLVFAFDYEPAYEAAHYYVSW